MLEEHVEATGPSECANTGTQMTGSGIPGRSGFAQTATAYIRSGIEIVNANGLRRELDHGSDEM